MNQTSQTQTWADYLTKSPVEMAFLDNRLEVSKARGVGQHISPHCVFALSKAR